MDDFEDDDPFARKRKKVRASCRVCYAFHVSQCGIRLGLACQGQVVHRAKDDENEKEKESDEEDSGEEEAPENVDELKQVGDRVACLSLRRTIDTRHARIVGHGVHD